MREAVGVCLEGYNSTVLAYGQSGSGKTHTMMGVDRVDTAGRSLRGVIPNVFAHIFGVVEDAPASVSFMLRVHYAGTEIAIAVGAGNLMRLWVVRATS